MLIANSRQHTKNCSITAASSSPSQRYRMHSTNTTYSTSERARSDSDDERLCETYPRTKPTGYKTPPKKIGTEPPLAPNRNIPRAPKKTRYLKPPPLTNPLPRSITDSTDPKLSPLQPPSSRTNDQPQFSSIKTRDQIRKPGLDPSERLADPNSSVGRGYGPK